MVEFTAVTEEDLERARQDPAFRQRMLSDNLEVLLSTLNKMRASSDTLDTAAAREVRDGVDLAVKLADLLETAKHENEPPKSPPEARLTPCLLGAIAYKPALRTIPVGNRTDGRFAAGPLARRPGVSAF
jgi:hypothetical protein